MTRDEQEALSIRYGQKRNIIVPLSSGSWAIFDNGFHLLGIAPTFAELEQYYREGPTPQALTRTPPPVSVIDLDLDLDLDLTL